MRAAQPDTCLFSNPFYLVTNAFKRCKVCAGEFNSCCLGHFYCSLFLLLVWIVLVSNAQYDSSTNSSTHIPQCKPPNFWKVLEGLNWKWPYGLNPDDCSIACLEELGVLLCSCARCRVNSRDELRDCRSRLCRVCIQN